MTLWSGPAQADRAVAPSDVLPPGSAGVAASLVAGRGSLTLSSGAFSSEADFHASQVVVELAAWGPNGLSFGLQQLFGLDQELSIDGSTTESADAGAGDLTLGMSWLPSLGRLRVGPVVAVQLETGSAEWTDNRPELELGGVAALSISAPVEVFFVPQYTITFEDEAGQNDGDDLFLRLGVNVRLARASIVPALVFGRRLDDENDEGGLTQIGGDAIVAFEVAEGLTPAFGLAANYVPSQEFLANVDVSGWSVALMFRIAFAGRAFRRYTDDR